jgi:hypothetical protein
LGSLARSDGHDSSDSQRCNVKRVGTVTSARKLHFWPIFSTEICLKFQPDAEQGNPPLYPQGQRFEFAPELVRIEAALLFPMGVGQNSGRFWNGWIFWNDVMPSPAKSCRNGFCWSPRRLQPFCRSSSAISEQCELKIDFWPRRTDLHSQDLCQGFCGIPKRFGLK